MDCRTPGFPVLHSPAVCSNSCPLSQWYYLTIPFSAAHFSFCPQSFPAPGFFPMSWLFTSGSQNIGTSATASVLPVNTRGWFPLGLIGLISLQNIYVAKMNRPGQNSLVYISLVIDEYCSKICSMGPLINRLMTISMHEILKINLPHQTHLAASLSQSLSNTSFFNFFVCHTSFSF